MEKSIDEQIEELQNKIGMIELQINRLLAEKSLLQTLLEDLLKNAER